MVDIFFYPLSVWFFFYLFNYSYLFESARNSVLRMLPTYGGYLLSCAFCTTFWLTAMATHVLPLSAWVIFSAPVTNLFLDLAYKKLAGVKE